MCPPPASQASAPSASRLSVRDLNRAISSGNLERVYLLHGEEEFLKDSKVQLLIGAALEPGERDFNLDVRQAEGLSAEDLDSLLNTPPMLAARRVVVIRDVTSLKKGARGILDRYLASPAPDLLLILTESGILPKTEKTLPASCCVVELKRLERDALEKWIEHHARTVLGVGISEPAIALLVTAVGDELAQLASELDKLASYSGDAVIDVSAVEQLVGVRHGETMADLLDAIAARDVGRSLDLLGHVLAQPRASAVSLLLAITAQTMGIAYARALLDEGEPASRLSGPLFDFLKAGKGVVTARPWGEAVSAWIKASGSWTSSELDAACDALLRTDILLKETRMSSDEQILSSLIMEICCGQVSADSKSS